ncbi:hypothetical protein N7491_008492 [Penicillium cf. griseofulvum]|uniref:Uncharacterized protein n=1 Tax=Penicillium cf. griseofulvum TaxID=2972120 RepID=A0A9W9SVK4_9EURO|nr:hypothetical protein N7472_005906 [Penicillium cf. griseofulvum]KAJ5423276.1 hypothetical protein N7491_008492 [Penicillium cf. griseofulvum]KAJ5431451.1 hypothetical protein N7445_009183 [Penicillium cf. griseofulvum]
MLQSHFWGHFFPLKLTFVRQERKGPCHMPLRGQGAQCYLRYKKAFLDLEGALIFIACDLTDLTNVKTAADAFLAREQRLDVLFNKAGLVYLPPLRI